MDKFLATRLSAVALLSVPAGFWLVGTDHAKAIRLASPTEQAAYVKFLQDASFGRTFIAVLVGGFVYVLLVELVAYVLRGGWWSRRASA